MPGEVWFTADTHFRHRGLIEHGHRPGFRSPEEHDDQLVTWWNETVRPRDQVWHLGDFGLGPAREVLAFRWKLHGEIHLVTGNHDAPWPANRDAHRRQGAWLAAGFTSVQAFARRRVRGRDVLLSHFPYEGDHTDAERAAQYRLRDGGLPLLHGHVHDQWLVRGRQLNVGVDVHGFRPVHLNTVADLVDSMNAAEEVAAGV